MRTGAATLVLVVAGCALWFLFAHRPLPVAPEPPASATRTAPPSRELARPSERHRTTAAVPPVAAKVDRLTTLAWGSGPEQVGRRRDPESAHEGPMAIALGRDGSVWLLDQVNGRVLHRDAQGRYGQPIRVRATAQDLRVDGVGGVAVLDRVGAQTLQRFDAEGRATDERPLTSFGVAEPGGTTGLFDDANGALYVEESLAGQGRRVVHAIGSNEVLAGRPSRGNDQLVTAAITARAAGGFEVRALDRDGTARFGLALSVGRPILSIALLDTDRAGNVYAGVLHAASTGAHDFADERLELFRVSPDGRLLARTSVPHPPSSLESFRELAVGDDGAVTWMHPLPDDSGEVIERIVF